VTDQGYRKWGKGSIDDAVSFGHLMGGRLERLSFFLLAYSENEREIGRKKKRDLLNP
jgi:hypothetical protein